MPHWISAFLEAQLAERDSSANTLDSYARDLRGFADWLTARDLHFATTDRADIEAYLITCEAEGLAQTTRARRLSSIKQLFRFAFEEGWRDTDPAQPIKGPGRARRLPKSLTEDEVSRLLQAAHAQKTHPLRTACMMDLIYATGLRVSELVSLPMTAARGDPRMILVRGKGGTERLVPLSPPARASLAAWVAHREDRETLARQKGKRGSPFLFPSRGRLGHVTRQSFHGLIKRLAVEAGISPAKVTPHTMRHAFATHLLANGADLRSIQTMLGHANLDTTEIYTHVLDERLRDLVTTHHPLTQDD